MLRILTVLSVFFLLTAAGITQSIRASDSSEGDSCYTDSIVLTKHRELVKSEPSTASDSLVTLTKASEFPVVESMFVGTFRCWIRINTGRHTGWIWRTKRWSDLPPEEKDTVAPVIRAEVSEQCYTAGRAYITGTMNMRAGASTNWKVTGQAHAGDSFSIRTSVQQDDYCWLQTFSGSWIAKTGRVSSTQPTAITRRTTTTVSSSNIPPIVEGDSAFKSGVRSAFAILRRIPKWYNYVMNARPASIGLLSTELSWHSGGRLDRGLRQIELNAIYSDHPLEASAVLVHEACHIYQMDDGRLRSQSTNVSEVQCYKKELEYLKEIAPRKYSLHRQVEQSIRRRGG